MRHVYKVGDWVLWLGPNDDELPAPGTVHRVTGHRPGVSVSVNWVGQGLWPMFLDEVRPATPEEVSRSQLASLEGL